MYIIYMSAVPKCGTLEWCLDLFKIVHIFVFQVIRMYTKQLLIGLEYLHENKIMHRDIKVFSLCCN